MSFVEWRPDFAEADIGTSTPKHILIKNSLFVFTPLGLVCLRLKFSLKWARASRPIASLSS
jgi:hypothetical protein